jgi:hypothetical protein
MIAHDVYASQFSQFVKRKTPGAGGATGSWARLREVKVGIYLRRSYEPAKPECARMNRA